MFARSTSKWFGCIAMALFLWSLPLAAEELSLEGDGVIQYEYPKNFKETNRYVRKGALTSSGDCTFKTNMRLKPGQRVFVRELAYNPRTCESLMIEGIYEGGDKPKRRNGSTLERPESTEHMAVSSSSDWSVRAYLRTWYDDPVYIDVNAVISEIWWDPAAGCAAGNYFRSQAGYEWLTATGWSKVVGKDSPRASCDNVSLDTTAVYRSNSFPTCLVQRAPVMIRYNKNLVKGYADRTAEMEFETIKAGPKLLCTSLLAENHEFYVEEQQVIVDGEIGCQGQPPALFFKELALKEGPINADASGNDYNGAPIYFYVDGFFRSDQVNLNIAMFGDSARTQHIRTDNCSGHWDGHSFYDGSCRLISNTSAGCVPVWARLTKSDNSAGAQSHRSPYEFGETRTLIKQ